MFTQSRKITSVLLYKKISNIYIKLFTRKQIYIFYLLLFLLVRIAVVKHKTFSYTFVQTFSYVHRRKNEKNPITSMWNCSRLKIVFGQHKVLCCCLCVFCAFLVIQTNHLALPPPLTRLPIRLYHVRWDSRLLSAFPSLACPRQPRLDRPLFVCQCATFAVNTHRWENRFLMYSKVLRLIKLSLFWDVFF